MRAVALAAALLLAPVSVVAADEITVLCPRGVQAPLTVISSPARAASTTC